MAHHDQFHFMGLVKAGMPGFFEHQRVLEVGSLDINGSIRGTFVDCDYTGIDVGPGPGVDLVVPGEEYDGPDAAFDVVVSCECMEHNPNWMATTANMMRMLRPGGLFVLTCASPGRREHGTSKADPTSSPNTVARGQEYYRNLDGAHFRKVPGLFADMAVTHDWVNWGKYDYYLLGIKKGASLPDTEWHGVVGAIDRWLEQPRFSVRHIIRRIAGARALDVYVNVRRRGTANS